MKTGKMYFWLKANAIHDGIWISQMDQIRILITRRNKKTRRYMSYIVNLTNKKIVGPFKYSPAGTLTVNKASDSIVKNQQRCKTGHGRKSGN